MHHARAMLLAGIGAALAFGIGDASAAPQVLGVVASNGPVPMTCDATGCRADLSSFCLQQPRANPGPDQAYRPAGNAAITLVGITATGETVRLPADDALRFVSARGFTAVEATLPADLPARLGLTSLAVEIGAGVSLLPEAAAGDSNPQTPEEIALATGAIRDKGAAFFDAPGRSGDAIRLANLMINTLPAHGRGPADSDGSVLEAALASAPAGVADPAGRSLVRTMFTTCRTKVDVTHHIATMRDCLAGSHDRLVVDTNIDFWRSLDGY